MEPVLLLYLASISSFGLFWFGSLEIPPGVGLLVAVVDCRTSVCACLLIALSVFNSALFWVTSPATLVLSLTPPMLLVGLALKLGSLGLQTARSSVLLTFLLVLPHGLEGRFRGSFPGAAARLPALYGWFRPISTWTLSWTQSLVVLVGLISAVGEHVTSGSYGSLGRNCC